MKFDILVQVVGAIGANQVQAQGYLTKAPFEAPTVVAAQAEFDKTQGFLGRGQMTTITLFTRLNSSLFYPGASSEGYHDKEVTLTGKFLECALITMQLQEVQ